MTNETLIPSATRRLIWLEPNVVNRLGAMRGSSGWSREPEVVDRVAV